MSETSGIEAVGASTQAMLKNFGGIVDWSEYGRQQIGVTFIRQTFYVRTGSTPLFMTLILYQPGAGWRVTDIQLGTYYNQRSQGFLIEP